MTSITTAVLGGDLRQCYLAGYMDTQGHDVICYGTMPLPYLGNHFISQADSLSQALEHARLVLCPMPFSTDGITLSTGLEHSAAIPLAQLAQLLTPGQLLAGGNFPPEFVSACREKQISLIDYMKMNALTQQNALLTAQGFLSILIAQTPFSLTRRKALLLGYGRCGEAIGKLLRYFDMKLWTFDENHHCQTAAMSQGITPISPEELSTMCFPFDVVINTIPARIVTRAQLARLKKSCILFDVASAPFGFDLNDTRQLSLRLVPCPGIPGKYMPQTAGELIGTCMLERILSHEY